MIKRMSKYAFLIYHREYEAFVASLQALGVVHVSHRKKPNEEQALKAILDERLEVRRLLRQLKGWLPEGSELTDTGSSVADGAIQRVTERLNVLEKSAEVIATLQGRCQANSPWGEYDPNLLQSLAQQGYSLVGYAIPPALYTQDYQTQYETITLSKLGMHQYFVRMETADSLPCPDAERHILPSVRLSELINEIEEAQKQRLQLEDELKSDAVALSLDLMALDANLEDRFAFGAVLLQGEKLSDDKLIFLEGWIPTEDAPAMEDVLREQGYYYRQCDIVKEDNVPISLKNNVFSRGFELITRMFSLPNYGEIDQTALFAPFFMLFFGLCMGDAGYGLLVFAISTYLKTKLKPGEDTFAYELMQWLGGGAFVIGLLMGSLFGVTLPYADHKDYFLNQDNLMTLSVVVGLLQILFAKGVAAYKVKLQQGMKYALAPFAWIVFLIVVGIVMAMPYVGLSMPKPVEYILYAIVGVSLAIMLFYNSPGKNPFINIGSALWKTYETASGLLGDTLSYIRLFAIGLTGAILGGVFNSLAVEQTASLPIVARLPLMLLILLAGHSINISLALIGALVHPIRLTFVEYYKNSEFEGGGVAYDPLKHSGKKSVK